MKFISWRADLIEMGISFELCDFPVEEWLLFVLSKWKPNLLIKESIDDKTHIQWRYSTDSSWPGNYTVIRFSYREKNKIFCRLNVTPYNPAFDEAIDLMNQTVSFAHDYSIQAFEFGFSGDGTCASYEGEVSQDLLLLLLEQDLEIEMHSNFDERWFHSNIELSIEKQSDKKILLKRIPCGGICFEPNFPH